MLALSPGCRRQRTGRSAILAFGSPLLKAAPSLFVSHVSAQVSAIFKIALGLMQCLSTLRSFSKVRWPETFAALIEAVDLFLIEAFAVVPAECIVGHRLGFFYELCATLTLPLISFLVIMLMAVLLYGWELHAARNSRQQHEDTLLQMLNRPQVWTLNILAWLVLFPSVTRKSLEAFDCVDLLGITYLRADPAIRCDDDQSEVMFAIAAGGVLYSCVLAPLVVIWQTTRKHSSPERVSRARVALLTYSYKDRYHYWEAVDLTRKMLLTSVVLLVGTDTILQVWFAAATGLAFLVIYLAFAPYRDEAASRIQLAALVQLEFTYMTAALFFDRKPQALQGEALVVANSLVVLILLVAALRSIGVIGIELRELQLTFVDDKKVVQLPMLNDEFATHL